MRIRQATLSLFEGVWETDAWYLMVDVDVRRKEGAWCSMMYIL